MKKTILAITLAASAGLAFTGCAANATHGMDSSATTQTAGQTANAQMPDMNWFGGPVYTGAPALEATAALVKAGGGADNFSFSQALVSMLGEDTVNAEVVKLQEQYGKEKVQAFIEGMTFDVNDGLKRATEAGITLPEAPADLKGPALAKALVKAGTAPDGTFWAGHLFDKAISHGLHVQVMKDVDAKYGHGADANTHRILNQAMYDVAQALGMKDVKLASFH